jgi:hypothetical protein
MSAYRGRTGPNFSEYLNNLNSLSPYEEENIPVDNIDFDNDLAMFTNTDFTQLDIPQLPEETGFNYSVNNEKPGETRYQDLLGGEAQNFSTGPVNTSPADTPGYYNYNTPIQPAPAATFGGETSSNQVARAAQGGPARRKTESVEPRGQNAEETSRVAAEEDKRRRNTAASARFRVKKKQREQALERNVKEINDQNAKLQTKIEQLEMENKWLKDLITEKNAIQSKEEIDEAFKRFKRESEERQDLRAESPRVKGVGTK